MELRVPLSLAALHLKLSYAAVVLVMKLFSSWIVQMFHEME